ncbi:MAG TPA: hypothetical protein VJN18_06300 [Polyangiaceae bacterium]|nr:hypothetical protein [Polyangiaceae bacterium]
MKAVDQKLPQREAVLACEILCSAQKQVGDVNGGAHMPKHKFQYAQVQTGLGWLVTFRA